MDCEDGGQIQARCSTVLYFFRVSYLKMNLKLYWGNERIEAEPLSTFQHFSFTMATVFHLAAELQFSV